MARKEFRRSPGNSTPFYLISLALQQRANSDRVCMCVCPTCHFPKGDDSLPPRLRAGHETSSISEKDVHTRTLLVFLYLPRPQAFGSLRNETKGRILRGVEKGNCTRVEEGHCSSRTFSIIPRCSLLGRGKCFPWKEKVAFQRGGKKGESEVAFDEKRVSEFQSISSFVGSFTGLEGTSSGEQAVKKWGDSSMLWGRVQKQPRRVVGR